MNQDQKILSRKLGVMMAAAEAFAATLDRDALVKLTDIIDDMETADIGRDDTAEANRWNMFAAGIIADLARRMNQGVL